MARGHPVPPGFGRTTLVTRTYGAGAFQIVNFRGGMWVNTRGIHYGGGAAAQPEDALKYGPAAIPVPAGRYIMGVPMP